MNVANSVHRRHELVFLGTKGAFSAVRLVPGANVQDFPDILARRGVPDVDVLSQRAQEVGGARVVFRRRRDKELLQQRHVENDVGIMLSALPCLSRVTQVNS